MKLQKIIFLSIFTIASMILMFCTKISDDLVQDFLYKISGIITVGTLAHYIKHVSKHPAKLEIFDEKGKEEKEK